MITREQVIEVLADRLYPGNTMAMLGVAADDVLELIEQETPKPKHHWAHPNTMIGGRHG